MDPPLFYHHLALLEEQLFFLPQARGEAYLSESASTKLLRSLELLLLVLLIE
jgi:hypothetical protein